MGVPCTSLIEILFEVLGQVINKHLVAHQPTLCVLWIPLRDLDPLPIDGHVLMSVIICGGVKGGRGVQVWWEGVNMEVTNVLHLLR